MYAVLEAEMERQGLSYRQLILKSGLTYSTMLPKLKGKSYTGDLTLIEATKLKNALGIKIKIEDLFGEDIRSAEEMKRA